MASGMCRVLITLLPKCAGKVHGVKQVPCARVSALRKLIRRLLTPSLNKQDVPAAAFAPTGDGVIIRAFLHQ